MKKRTALGICLLAVAAFATEPPYVSDAELAKYPIVVQARWGGRALANHSKASRNVLETWELRTNIVVERVIRGDLRPGTYTLLIGWPITWRQSGGPVRGVAGTRVTGDVDDVRESNLWFLRRRRSWDKRDKEQHLFLDSYRGVQPLMKRAYFRALARENPQPAIAGMLGTGADPRIAKSALMHISGGYEMPWPYDSYGAQQGERPQPEYRKEFREEVTQLLEHPNGSIRARAAAVFSDMNGEQSVPTLRQLLNDDDAEVRGVAIGWLAHWNDEVSLDAIERLAPTVGDAYLACKVIERLAAWGHEETATAVIPFLQDDTFAAQFGDDMFVPALKAQAALEVITGHRFPCDVAAATRAWANARRLEDVEKRAEVLGAQAPAVRAALTGRCKRVEGDTFAIAIQNRSDHAILVPRRPQRGNIAVEFDGGGSIDAACRFDAVAGPKDFTWLRPGATLEIPVTLRRDKLHSVRPGEHSMTIWFLENGNGWGLNAWLGRVEVTLTW